MGFIYISIFNIVYVHVAASNLIYFVVMCPCFTPMNSGRCLAKKNKRYSKTNSNTLYIIESSIGRLFYMLFPIQIESNIQM